MSICWNGRLIGIRSVVFLSVLLIFGFFGMETLADTQQSLSKISEKEADVFRKKRGKDHVPIITIGKLGEKFGDVTIVDVRSEFEYQTLHIAGAVSVTIATRGFERKILNLRKAKPKKAIVFYCNGFL